MRSVSRLFRLAIVAAAFVLVAPRADAQDSAYRLYGTVTTTSGNQFTGLIRWDKNEVSWLDILDANKEVESEDGSSVRIAGIRIAFDGDRTTRKSTGIRMGHIQRLEVTGRDEALLTLRSGAVVEFVDGSGDIGTSNRGIIVEDAREGKVELEWRDIETVDFAEAPSGTTSVFGERLYGTLTLRNGDSFTGFVCWDVDETFTEDILDGEDQNDIDREIPFGILSEIRRESRNSATVVRRDGATLTLRGTNDVDHRNKDILILDPTLGQVRVDWEDYTRLVFATAPTGMDARDFQDGPLVGTVAARNGDKYTGTIVWDQDEAYTWELLDGEMGGVEFKVEFGQIAEIHRVARSRAEVRLRDGRVLRLGDSNDVNDNNDGIAVTTESGERILIDWDDFDYVIFAKP